MHTVVDATRDLLVNVLQYHPFLIKPNNHELGEIVGRTLTTDTDITAAARTLQEKGARNVLVSMAGDGALLLDEKGEVHRIGTPKGKVVNSAAAQITGTGLLSLAEETRPIRGGFILVDGPVEVNCSFETLVRLQREKLENQAAELLFEN